VDLLSAFLLPNLVLLAGGATVFTLARRWPRQVFAALSGLLLVGIALLGYAAAAGIAYNVQAGQVSFASPAAQVAFRVGLPMVSVATAALLVGMLPAESRWAGSAAGAVKDVAVRSAGVWLGGGLIGFVLYTALTGHFK
jgi:hypothetical protein